MYVNATNSITGNALFGVDNLTVHVDHAGSLGTTDRGAFCVLVPMHQLTLLHFLCVCASLAS